MESNKVIDQEDQVLLAEVSNNSTSVSTTELTSTSTCLQDLFLQYLYKVVFTILCIRCLYKGISTIEYPLSLLQMSLRMSLYEDILHYLYKGISTTVHLLLYLLTSIRCEVIQPSLRASLQSEILQSSLLAFLRSGIIQSSILVSLRSGTL